MASTKSFFICIECFVKEVEIQSEINGKFYRSDKMKKYLITMRWFVESDEELTDDGVLKLLQHKHDGRESCSSCPTRKPHGFAVLDHESFMDRKPTYISTEQIIESE